jgi:DNA-binding transcriptional MerR regulator
VRISEISEKHHISQDALRYYERIGLLPPVNRKRGGIRDYTKEDERWVEFVTCMRGAGLSIEALIEYVSLCQQGDKTSAERKALLVGQRDVLISKIEELKKTLARLEKKIDSYERVLLKKERSMGGFGEEVQNA